MKVWFKELESKDYGKAAALMLAGMKTWNAPIMETAKDIEARLQDPSKQTIVAVYQNKLVGISAWQPELSSFDPRSTATKHSAHMASLFVDPVYHGTGLANDLLTKVLENINKERYQEVRLWVAQDAKRAKAFYQKHGWEPTTRTMTYQGLKRMEMVLDLKRPPS